MVQQNPDRVLAAEFQKRAGHYRTLPWLNSAENKKRPPPPRRQE